jgi:uncharacterized protein YodC (DUF2158 family)
VAQSFKDGDVVQLKSGGPKMTIDKIAVFFTGGNEQARCVWFDGSKRMTDVFSLDSLTKA